MLPEAVGQLVHNAGSEIIQTSRDLVADNIDMESMRKHLWISDGILGLYVFGLCPVRVHNVFRAIIDCLQLLWRNYNERSAIDAGGAKNLITLRVLDKC
jgi:hypothetical protein